MKELLKFILEGITGNKDFDIEETEEDGKVDLQVKVPTSDMGLVIGKGGTTIKAITTVLRVKGRLEKKLVNVNVIEK